jgi:DNA-directed RNA polymerase specialized sigma24 family protein
VRAAERDAAFSEFVHSRRTHLRRVAYAICGDWHRADDLVQTALVKLYVAWPRVRRAGNEEAYVRTIIVRANVDEHRRPWRREQPGLPAVDAAAPEGLSVEDGSALFAALQDLPVMQR